MWALRDGEREVKKELQERERERGQLASQTRRTAVSVSAAECREISIQTL